jgi:hypothetical protein
VIAFVVPYINTVQFDVVIYILVPFVSFTLGVVLGNDELILISCPRCWFRTMLGPLCFPVAVQLGHPARIMSFGHAETPGYSHMFSDENQSMT